jgi:hypothetical protein
MKRLIEAVNLIGSSEEDLDTADKNDPNASFNSIILDDSEFMTPGVEPIPTKPAWIPSKVGFFLYI